MKVTIIHGARANGNTYKALQIFKDNLNSRGDVTYSEFLLPQALPDFCTGCQLCLSKGYRSCPHSLHTIPILETMIDADALVFTSPNFSLNVSGAMKNLLDHFDHLFINVCPDERIFEKKAFILTTGSGSKKAVSVISGSLKYWGVNRVYSYGIRMYTDKFESLTEKRLQKIKKKLSSSAEKFYKAKKRPPYFSIVIYTYIARYILKRFVGKDGYPYKYWDEKGFLKSSPFKKRK